MCKYIEEHLEGYVPQYQMQVREQDWGGIKIDNTTESSLHLFYFQGIYVHQVNTHWGLCGLVCLPRWHATFWQM